MVSRVEKDPLSPRQREVLSLAMSDMSDKEIAARLGMATSTVRTHVARLCEKLGATNRCQLARFAADAYSQLGPVAGPSRAKAQSK